MFLTPLQSHWLWTPSPLCGSPMIKDPGRRLLLPDLCVSPAAGRSYRLQYTSFSPDDNLTSSLFVNVTLMALIPFIRLLSSHRGLFWVRRPPTAWPCPTSACISRLPERELTVFIHVWQQESALQVFISCFKGNCSVLRCTDDDISVLDSSFWGQEVKGTLT